MEIYKKKLLKLFIVIFFLLISYITIKLSLSDFLQVIYSLLFVMSALFFFLRDKISKSKDSIIGGLIAGSLVFILTSTTEKITLLNFLFGLVMLIYFISIIEYLF